MKRANFLASGILVLWLGPTVLGQSSVESRVLGEIRAMMQESGGRVTFSELHNDPRWGNEEKIFLGRLYEIFFEIPGLLKHQFEANGEVPLREDLAAQFGISKTSVELLLTVMEQDSRVPPLFQRDSKSREISSLELVNIDAFLARRGDSVKITQWEGQQLPSFRLTAFDGQSLSDGDLKGTESLIYFWFSGCPPCVRIAPLLVQLDREYRPKGLRIVGFNADQVLGIEISDGSRNSYLEKTDTTYTNVHLDNETRRAFGNVNIYPMLFFVDSQGTIKRHLVNFQDLPTLQAAAQATIEGAR